jgi:hypothetical protein
MIICELTVRPLTATAVQREADVRIMSVAMSASTEERKKVRFPLFRPLAKE